MQNWLVEATRFANGFGRFAKLASWLPPAAVALVALSLRLHGLGDKPFWLDEVTTLHRATITLPNLIAESLHSKHYPSYFMLLWLVAKLGTSQWLLRLPSAVFGAVSAALAYAIGNEADGRRTGTAAGLLLALSPFDIQYGQEARSYTLVACLILIALWGLVRLAREPTLVGTPLSHKHRPPLPWIAYGFGTTAALNVLNVAIPWLVAANLAALAIAWRAGEGRKAFWRNWAWVQAFVLVTWLPFFIAVCVLSHGTVLRGEGWAPPETWATLWSIVAPVYLYRISAFITFDLMPSAVPWLSAIIALLALAGAWRLRHRPAILAVIGGSALALPLLLLLVSLLTPVLVARYFAWSAAPFFVLAGAGIGQLASRRFAVAGAAIAMVALINLAPYYHDETKPRWDLAAKTLAAEAQPGDVILVDSRDAYEVFSAFAARNGLDKRVALTWTPADAARLSPGHDLWVVYGRTGQGKMIAPADYANSLAPVGTPDTGQSFGSYVIAWRFNTPDAIANACGGAQTCPNPPVAQP
ncbi:MAG TPA: glycosyltransferase family 39 protein [Stellaceae bacterium]|jgi:uncharacterized membrane protein